MNTPRYQDVERTHRLTWGELAELAPELNPLLWRARQASAACRDWQDQRRVFGEIRNELAGLVGFSGKRHRHPVLGSVAAYEVAYWRLYDATSALLPRPAHSPAEETANV